jgi:hypothetical protein
MVLLVCICAFGAFFPQRLAALNWDCFWAAEEEGGKTALEGFSARAYIQPCGYLRTSGSPSEKRDIDRNYLGGLPMLKYKSDAMEAIYEDALANFEVGAITRDELAEYESACIVSETTPILASKSAASSSWAGMPSPTAFFPLLTKPKSHETINP